MLLSVLRSRGHTDRHFQQNVQDTAHRSTDSAHQFSLPVRFKSVGESLCYPALQETRQHQRGERAGNIEPPSFSNTIIIVLLSLCIHWRCNSSATTIQLYCTT